jgi:hypothetical protein
MFVAISGWRTALAQGDRQALLIQQQQGGGE